MARGKEKQAGIVKNVQAFERLSFLHQAAILMSTLQYDTKPSTSASAPKHHVRDWQGDPPGTLHATSRYLNHHMKQITGKLVMRLDPSVKRAVCKRCDTPVIPVITSTSRIKSKPTPSVIQTCKICKSKRRYTSQNPSYQLFSERSDVDMLQEAQDQV
ncbi:Urease accessory protein UreG [Mucor velutinosus]|uniref:Urease accessory protein UreG n=1 Tax=Mucor velutinosus TaxID=708070 RepID=A0AAN7D5G8_9FUNG|nr:Urease accessory protein UreG [Mucor velutinosus]